jgi:capsular polysaccharide transport system permease protein
MLDKKQNVRPIGEGQPPVSDGGAPAGQGARFRPGQPGQGPAQAGGPGAAPGPGQGRPMGGQAPGQGPARPAPPPPVIEIRPAAGPARMHRRHWGLVLGFLLMVALPFGATVGYLWLFATDQYSSTTGFTVRSEERGSATDLLGGLAQFAGSSTSSDADILYEFIQSQELVEEIDAKMDLRGHYSAPRSRDPVFALQPDATVEDLVRYWQRMVRIAYDQATGLIEVQVLAFDPEYARSLAAEIVAASQEMINDLNDAARSDRMRYARADLNEALSRLKTAREALLRFRTRTQIVDPAADIQGRMGVLNNLQQQLAQALIEFDLVSETAGANDPRLTQAQRRIEVIRERIAQERENVTSESGRPGETDYPALLAEYESLNVDRQFAEETYRAALAALDIARSNASRQSLYLATYIRPTVPQSSDYPQRWVLAGLALLFLSMAWAILALVFYSLRDRQ